jgi:hypothetical protein
LTIDFPRGVRGVAVGLVWAAVTAAIGTATSASVGVGVG